MKRGGSRTALIFLLVAFLVVFTTASFVANIKSKEGITAKVIEVGNSNIIRIPNSYQELPDTNQGTVFLRTKPPVKILDQFADSREYILFFSTKNIPGVRIVYNIKEQRFEAGSPIISSPRIDIFDDKIHEIVYTYKKGEKQFLFIDGENVNSSVFEPVEIVSVTGFAIAEGELQEVDIMGIEMSVYAQQLDKDQIKNN